VVLIFEASIDVHKNNFTTQTPGFTWGYSHSTPIGVVAPGFTWGSWPFGEIIYLKHYMMIFSSTIIT